MSLQAIKDMVSVSGISINQKQIAYGVKSQHRLQNNGKRDCNFVFIPVAVPMNGEYCGFAMGCYF